MWELWEIIRELKREALKQLQQQQQSMWAAACICMLIRCLFYFFFGRLPSSQLFFVFTHPQRTDRSNNDYFTCHLFFWLFIKTRSPYISIWLGLRDAVTIYLDNLKQRKKKRLLSPTDWFQRKKPITTNKNHF